MGLGYTTGLEAGFWTDNPTPIGTADFCCADFVSSCLTGGRAAMTQGQTNIPKNIANTT